MPGIRLNSLSSLRFLAASAVVIYHLLPGWVGVNYLLWPRMLLNLLGLACVGLPFFYALSGFVLYYVYREDPPRERKKLFLFWVKRFARIAPTFYLSLLLGIWPFLQELIAAHGTGPGLVRTALYLIANLFFLSAWLPFTLNFNFPTWSISVEIFCYLLFPFLLQRAARLSRAETWFGLACAYFTGAVIQGGAVLIWPELAHWPYEPGNLSSNLTNFLQLNPLVHLPEFLFGVLLGRLWHLQKGERPRGDACLLGGDRKSTRLNSSHT